MSFPDRLKKLREEKGLTQLQLSTKINVSKSSIGGYERGTKKPSIGVLKTLSGYFDVATDYLLGKSNIRGGYEQVISLIERKPELLDALINMSSEKQEVINYLYHLSEDDLKLIKTILCRLTK